MINVMVSYQVQPGFVKENKSNIENFLESFKSLDNTKFTYSIFLDSDGVTFTHISSYRDEHIQRQVLHNASFMEFQKKRDESGLNNTHKIQVLECIGSTKAIL